MINKQQAEVLAEKWRAKFVDEEAFKASWARYFASATAPTPERLDQWLSEDAESAAAAAVVSTKEPLLPVRQDLPDLVDDCGTCRGKRWVRRDLPVSHAEFGRALRCPHCR